MKQQVIIIGGGFGGLETAFSLRDLLKRQFEIALIDKTPYHSFLPSIHLIISGKVSSGQIRIPLKPMLGAAGMRFIQGEVRSLDPGKREVTAGGTVFRYDCLVLSCGAENNFFNIPGAEAFSFRFRTIQDAERIRKELLVLLSDPSRICRIVIAGAGTEGVEIIGELLDLIRKDQREDDFKSGRISLELVEGKNRILPGLPREAQDRVQEFLETRGIKITAGERVAEVRKDRILLASGQSRLSSVLIWSGGIQPSGLIRHLPFSKDPWGWLKVNDRLQVPEDECIYGIGDAVSIYTPDGPLALPRLAYHARDQARSAALNIFYQFKGRKQIPYVPKNKPRLISLGSDAGILSTEDKVFLGPWVVSLKKAVEREHLLACLSRPLPAALPFRLPGIERIHRVRTKLPV